MSERSNRLCNLAIAGAIVVLGLATAPAAHASCAAPANAIEAENCQPGTPEAIWDVKGAPSENIAGFATDISVDQGQTVHFKIKSDAAYRIDIYRLGWYQGLGARLMQAMPQRGASNQPECGFAGDTGLVNCSNWSESAAWTVPPNATSGIYIAHLVRMNGTGESHVPFVVRDDDGHSDLLFQTSDTTWQAYNTYGDNSLYTAQHAGTLGSRAYKVSYNRPFRTRGVDSGQDWLFNSEYPMLRWLERNGYDVSYFTGVDSDRRGSKIRNHRVFMSVAHDEYWSGTQRANVEAARDAGVSLAFFSGNEVFWKTRWENDHRTLVTYKETHGDAVDPSGESTGSWRDPRFGSDGGRPENALTGTIFMVTQGTVAIKVPADDGEMRFWRGTDVAGLGPGMTKTLTDGTLGYEWDEDLDNGSRPAGLVRLSSTTATVPGLLQDYGSTYAPGSATHHLTLYRDTNGLGLDSLVFGAGTVQWSWGLDDDHDNGNPATTPAMQQATANLFADMSVQPATPFDVQRASCSTDRTAPSASVAPVAVTAGASMTIHGTAADGGGGRVGGVEVSVDGGASWHPATGRESWAYTWTPTASGTVTPLARAADDSGNQSGSDPFTSRDCVGATIPGDGTASGGTPRSGGVAGAHAGRTRIRVKVSRRSVRASRKGVVRLRVSCPKGPACRVHVRLRRKGHTLAGRTRTVPGGKTRTFELKLSRSARRTLLRKRVLRVIVVASVANGRTTTVHIRLLAPKSAGQRP